jgi:hypothetical protein
MWTRDEVCVPDDVTGTSRQQGVITEEGVLVGRASRTLAVDMPCVIRWETKPNATGPLWRTIAAPTAAARRSDGDMLATPTARPSAAAWTTSATMNVCVLCPAWWAWQLPGGAA